MGSLDRHSPPVAHTSPVVARTRTKYVPWREPCTFGTHNSTAVGEPSPRGRSALAITSSVEPVTATTSATPRPDARTDTYSASMVVSRRQRPTWNTPKDVSKLSVAPACSTTPPGTTLASPVVRAYRSGSGVVGVGSTRRCNNCVVLTNRPMDRRRTTGSACPHPSPRACRSPRRVLRGWSRPCPDNDRCRGVRGT